MTVHIVDYVIYSLWIVFWVGWLAAGSGAKRAAQSRMGQFLGLRIGHSSWPTWLSVSVS